MAAKSELFFPAFNGDACVTMFSRQQLQMPSHAFDSILRAIDVPIGGKHGHVGTFFTFQDQVTAITSVASENDFSDPAAGNVDSVTLTRAMVQ